MEIIGIIVPIKYMPIVSAVGLFYCDKFEETPKQKVIDLPKFKKITLMCAIWLQRH